MTETQLRILELLDALGEDERRELAQHIYDSTLAATFYSRMTAAQRAHLQEGIDQAERGEGEEASKVFDRLARKLEAPRA